MAISTIDYAELARQAGAISSEPAAKKVDYAALAKEAGVISSESPQDAIAVEQLRDAEATFPKGQPGKVEAFNPDGSRWTSNVEPPVRGMELLGERPVPQGSRGADVRPIGRPQGPGSPMGILAGKQPMPARAPIPAQAPPPGSPGRLFAPKPPAQPPVVQAPPVEPPVFEPPHASDGPQILADEPLSKPAILDVFRQQTPRGQVYEAPGQRPSPSFTGPMPARTVDLTPKVESVGETLSKPLVPAEDISKELGTFLVGPFDWIHRTAIDAAMGLTSPINLGILAVTGGISGLAKTAESATARAAVKAVQGAISTYFAGSIGQQMTARRPELLKALKENDWYTVFKVGGQDLVDAIFAGSALAHAAQTAKEMPAAARSASREFQTGGRFGKPLEVKATVEKAPAQMTDAELLDTYNRVGQGGNEELRAEVAKEVWKRKLSVSGIGLPPGEETAAGEPPAPEPAKPASQAAPKPPKRGRQPAPEPPTAAPEAAAPPEPRPVVTKAPSEVTVEAGHTYETPTGSIAVTGVQDGLVTFDHTLTDGTVIPAIKIPMARFLRSYFPQAPSAPTQTEDTSTLPGQAPSIPPQSPVVETPTIQPQTEPGPAPASTATDPLSQRIASMNLPDYVKDTLREDAATAERLGIVEEIEQKSAERLTAKQIANALQIPGDTLDKQRVVRSVRAILGIPSMDDATEFNTWLQSRVPPAPSRQEVIPNAPVVPEGAGVQQQTEILSTFPGEENTEAVVAKIQGGYSVVVRDKDSGEILPEVRVFGTQEQAEAFAKTIAPPKEPWQMTRDEYHDEHLDWVTARRDAIGKGYDPGVPDPDIVHRKTVEYAISSGLPVPPEVLADYPDLISSPPEPAAAAPQAPPLQPAAASAVPEAARGGEGEIKRPRAFETSDATFRTNVGGGSTSFEINSGGAKVVGYSAGQDFPNQPSKPDRGEIFYVEVPEKERRAGRGYSLVKDALRVIAANGGTTVNMSGVSDSGRGLIDKLLREGEISGPIQTSQSGKAEYKLGAWSSQTAPAPGPATAKTQTPQPGAPSSAKNAPSTTTTPTRTQTVPPSGTTPTSPAEHSFSSTQVNLPPDFAQQVLDYGKTIPDDILAGDGRETEPHITVRYGSDEADHQRIAAALAGKGPIKAKVKGISIFPNVDTDGGKADVVKLDIDSPDLRKLNALVGKSVPHPGETHPEYKPHITLAYVRAGEGKKYAGRAIKGLSGQTITFNAVTFSPKSGEKTEIPLVPTRATDNSVRDFPVSAAFKDGKVVASLKLSGKVYGSVMVTADEWHNPPGGTIGNPDYDRRQMIRTKMEALKLADFNADGADQAERIADSVMAAIRKVMPAAKKPTGPARFKVGENVETLNPVTRAWEKGKVSTLEPNGQIGVSMQGSAPYLFAPQHVRGVAAASTKPAPNIPENIPNETSGLASGKAPNLYQTGKDIIASGMTIGSREEPLLMADRGIEVYFAGGAWWYRNSDPNAAEFARRWTRNTDPQFHSVIEDQMKRGELKEAALATQSAPSNEGEKGEVAPHAVLGRMSSDEFGKLFNSYRAAGGDSPSLKTWRGYTPESIEAEAVRRGLTAKQEAAPPTDPRLAEIEAHKAKAQELLEQARNISGMSTQKARLLDQVQDELDTVARLREELAAPAEPEEPAATKRTFSVAAVKKAENYIGRLQNEAKRKYATSYFRSLQGIGVAVRPPDLSVMAAQAVRMQLTEILGEPAEEAQPEPSPSRHDPGALGNYIDSLRGNDASGYPLKEHGKVYAKSVMGETVDPTERQNAIHALPEDIRQRIVDLAKAQKAWLDSTKKPSGTAPVEPSADRFDEIQAEMVALQFRKDLTAAQKHNRMVDLEREAKIHEPAAIAKAQAEIDGEKKTLAEGDLRIGDVVTYKGQQYEVSFVNPGGSMRLADLETKERIPGWISPTQVEKVEAPAGPATTATTAAAGISPADIIKAATEALRAEQKPTAPKPAVAPTAPRTRSITAEDALRRSGLTPSTKPIAAPKTTALDSQADEATARMRARMEARRRNSIDVDSYRPTGSEAAPQQSNPIDKQDLIDLTIIGARQILRLGNGANFDTWSWHIRQQVEDLVSAVADDTGQEFTAVLQEIYGYAAAAAEQLGVKAEPLESNPKEPIIKSESEDASQNSTGAPDRSGLEEGVPEGNGQPAAGRPGRGGKRGGRAGSRSPVAVRGQGDELEPVDGTGTTGVGDSAGSLTPKSNSVGNTAHEHDYRIPDNRVISGSPESRARANLDAIAILKQVQGENRPASQEEKEILARYVGWGAVKQLFAGLTPEWKELQSELRQALTEQEYADAERSVTNAHYTGDWHIDAIWKALQGMGAKPGMVWLEPAVGIGTFFGRQPAELLQGARRMGIDKDSVVGQIAQMLYPDSGIDITPFEESELPKDYFDGILSNVPFGEFGVSDDEFRGKPYLTEAIHNYFFAKSLTMVRPGGMIAFITSRYTMDAYSAGHRNFRQWIDDQADFIGAVRMPTNAFMQNAGTHVITDIIFLRKRLPGAEPSGEAWVETEDIRLRAGSGPAAGQTFKQVINEYYARHPENILGNQTLARGRFSDHDYKIDGQLTPEILNAALSRLPENVFQDFARAGRGKSLALGEVAVKGAKEFKLGGLFFDDHGTLFRKVSKGAAEPMEGVSEPDKQRIRGQIGLRDAAKSLLDAERADEPASTLDLHRQKLNLLYDRYVHTHGPLSTAANIKVFSTDPDAPVLLSLERNWDPKKRTASKAPLFERRMLPGQQKVSTAGDPQEAMWVALNETAHLDFDRMAELTGQPAEQIQRALSEKNLIYLSPDTRTWETADEYLSGAVRTKLRQARAVAKLEPDFKRNVEALEAVQPVDFPPSRITGRLGATWIPREIYNEFAKEVLGAESAEVQYIGSLWDVKAVSPAATKWHTGGASALSLLQHNLNSQLIKVYTRDEHNNPVIDQKETLAAQEMQKELGKHFERWLFTDADRGTGVARIYNDVQNDLRLRQFDGSHLTLPGMTRDAAVLRGGNLDPHQLAAVWRMIVQRNVLLAHAPGAGKTFAMIAAGMELQRLGLAHRPMFVVPNDTLTGWEEQFRSLYPGKRVLVFSETDLKKDKRRLTIAKIATGEWDAVVIPHSSFQLIRVSDATFNRHYARLESLLERQIMDAEGAGLDARFVRRLQVAKEALLTRLKNLRNAGRQDRTVNWEELAIDQLFVDESHYYKKLGFSTRQAGVAGIDQNGNQKTFDMLMKVRHTQEHGRGVVFATGTPVTNTMGELYNIMQYLIPQELGARGMSQFDEWASAYGVTVPIFEPKPEGGGYQNKARFSEFINRNELSQFYRSFADVMTSKMLDIPRPAIAGGGRRAVERGLSSQQQEFLTRLQGRASRIRANARAAMPDNMLSIFGDATAMTLDVRIVDSAAHDDRTNRLTAAADEIWKLYQASASVRGTQLVFSDMGVPADEKRKVTKPTLNRSGQPRRPSPSRRTDFSVYDDLIKKLIARGIPADQIATVYQAKNKLQRRQLFEKFNAGAIRVMLGSTQKMGVGVNVQERVFAIHHLSIPDRPDQLEQREARGVRQGNRNPEVHIVYYITKGSLDELKFGTVKRKAKFNEQFQGGEGVADRGEDVGEMVASFEAFQAASSSDPRVMRKLQLDNEVERMAAISSAWRDQQWRDRWEVQRIIPEEIQNERRAIASYTEMARTRDKAGRVWEVVGAGGKTQKWEGDGILNDVSKAIAAAVLKIRNTKDKLTERIGSAYGLELSSDGAWIYIGPRFNNVPGSHAYVADAEELGYAARVNNFIRGLDNKISEAEEKIAKNKKRGTELIAVLEAEQEWPRQAEYDKLVAEQQALFVALGGASGDASAAMATDGQEVADDTVAASEENEDGAEASSVEDEEAGVFSRVARREQGTGAISEYPNGQGRLAAPDKGWMLAQINGKEIHTNGHFVLQGHSPSEKIAKNPPDLQQFWNREIARPGEESQIQPAAFSKAEDEEPSSRNQNNPPSNYVWMSNGVPVNSKLYDYILKRFPDAQWMQKPGTETRPAPIIIRSKGEIVGYLMSMKVDPSPDVKAILEAATPDVQPYRPQARVSPTPVGGKGVWIDKGKVIDTGTDMHAQIAERAAPGSMFQDAIRKMLESGSIRIRGENIELYERALDTSDFDLAVEQAIKEAKRKRAPSIGLQVHRPDGFRPYTRVPLEDVGELLENPNRYLQSSPETVDIDSNRPVPGFYSQLTRAIEAKMPAKASPDQIAGILSNPANGVKPDERKWTGIDLWLADQKGKPVTKQEVLDYLKQNEVRVEEVTLGDAEPGKPLTWTKRDSPDGDLWIDQNDQYDIYRGHGFTKFELIDRWAGKTIGQFGTLADAQAGAIRPVMRPTKYSNYTTPGGSDYRELLLTLPIDTNSAWSAHRERLSQLTAQRDQRELELRQNSDPSKTTELRRLVTNAEMLLEMAMKKNPEKTAGYVSPHWDEPNVIAHLRVGIYRTPEGKRVGVMIENQSDWGQAGRKHGFLSESAAQLQAEHKRISDEATEAAMPLRRALGDEDDLGFSSPMQAMQAIKSHADWKERWEVSPELAALGDRWRDAVTRLDEVGKRAGKPGIPQMPFPKTWHELVFRRFLRWCAENDLDEAAWNTGEQQADRYDLSKQIDAIHYAKLDDGTYQVNAEKDGATVASQTGPAEKIEDFVGKDIASKIVNGEGSKFPGRAVGRPQMYKLSGVDLKVGGEGMKGFYDKIMPDYAARYGKKWGAKVGETKIAVSPKSDLLVEMVNDGLWEVNSADDPGDMPLAEFPTRQEALNYVDSLDRAETLHSIAITPAMRDSVMQGQPLFYKPPVIPKVELKGPFISKAGFEFHAQHAAIKPVELEPKYAEIADAYAANLSGMEVFGRGAGKKPDVMALEYAGVHVGPKDAGAIARNIGLLMRPMIGTGRAPLPAGARELQQACERASKAGKSILLVNSSPWAEQYHATAVLEEIHHAVQARLTGKAKSHLGPARGLFMAHPIYGVAAERLNKTYTDHVPGSENEATEVGVRLMRKDGYKELGLTVPQARSLAAHYVRTLRQEYGSQRPKQIAAEVFDAFRGTTRRGATQPGAGLERPGSRGGGGAPGSPGPDLSGNRPPGRAVYDGQPRDTVPEGVQDPDAGLRPEDRRIANVGREPGTGAGAGIRGRDGSVLLPERDGERVLRGREPRAADAGDAAGAEESPDFWADESGDSRVIDAVEDILAARRPIRTWDTITAEVQEASDETLEKSLPRFLKYLKAIEGKEGIRAGLASTASGLAKAEQWATLQAFLNQNFAAAADAGLPSPGKPPRVSPMQRMEDSPESAGVGENHIMRGMISELFFPKTPDASGPVSKKAIRSARAQQNLQDIPDWRYRSILKRETGKTSTKDLTKAEAERLMEKLTAVGVETLGLSRVGNIVKAVHSPSWWLKRSGAGEKIYDAAQEAWFEQERLADQTQRWWHKANRKLSKDDINKIGLYRDTKQLLDHYSRVEAEQEAEQKYAANERRIKELEAILNGEDPAPPEPAVEPTVPAIEKVKNILAEAGEDPSIVDNLEDFLSPKLRAVSDRWSQIFEWTRQKGVEAGFLKPEQKIDSYLPFYFDKFFEAHPDKINAIAAEMALELGIPERLAAEILQKANAKNVKFGSFDMQRLGWILPGMRDPNQRFEIYSKGFARKMAVTHFLREADRWYPRIQDPQIKELAHQYMNQYAGKSAGAGSATTARIAGWITSLQYMAKIGFNLWSPILNLTQTITNTIPQVGFARTMAVIPRAFASTMLPKELNPFVRDLVRLQHAEILDTFSTKFERPKLTGAKESVQQAASFLFDKAEEFNRAVAYLAGLEEAKAKGLKGDAAVRHAREVVRITQFFAGRLDAPLMARTPVGKVFMQFKTFTLKEIEFIRQLDWKQKIKFLVAALLLGGPAALGIVQALKRFFPDDDITKKAEELQESYNLAALLHAQKIVNQFGIFTVPGLEDFGGNTLKPRILEWAAGPTLNSMIDIVMASGIAVTGTDAAKKTKEQRRAAAEKFFTTLVRGWMPGGSELLRAKRAMDEAKTPIESVRILVNFAEPKKKPASGWGGVGGAGKW